MLKGHLTPLRTLGEKVFLKTEVF